MIEPDDFVSARFFPHFCPECHTPPQADMPLTVSPGKRCGRASNSHGQIFRGYHVGSNAHRTTILTAESSLTTISMYVSASSKVLWDTPGLPRSLIFGVKWFDAREPRPIKLCHSTIGFSLPALRIGAAT